VPGIKTTAMKEAGSAYRFRKGLNCVNADAYVLSHTDFRNPEVAWMIWAAVLGK
jgi:hypothetical protein